MHPQSDLQQGAESSGDSLDASSLSIVSRHLHRLQGQVNRLQAALFAHQRTLDGLEVQGANHTQSLLALFLCIILLLQLVRLVS